MNPENKKIEETKKLLCPKAGTATSFPTTSNSIPVNKYCECNSLYETKRLRRHNNQKSS